MKRWVQVRTRWQWDRYCLWLSVGGGNLAGIVWVAPGLSTALGAPIWSAAWHHTF